MAVKLFKRGYDAVKKEKERQDKIREEMGTKLFTFYLKDDGDEADIRFLTEEPITFDAHTVRDGKNYSTVICPKDGCALCEADDKPSFMGAYIIIDKREYEVLNKKTNKKEKRHGSLRLYMPRSRVLSQLDRLSLKNGLTKRDYTIVRLGSGQNTTYTFEPHETSKVTRTEIENVMTDKLREQYDGTHESVYEILQEQLNMMLSDNEGIPDTEIDEDDVPTEKNKRSNLVDVDDEEAPQEEKPKRTGGLKAPKIKGMFKKTKKEVDDDLPF